jgi:hypothetical protein
MCFILDLLKAVITQVLRAFLHPVTSICVRHIPVGNRVYTFLDIAVGAMMLHQKSPLYVTSSPENMFMVLFSFAIT